MNRQDERESTDEIEVTPEMVQAAYRALKPYLIDYETPPPIIPRKGMEEALRAALRARVRGVE